MIIVHIFYQSWYLADTNYLRGVFLRRLASSDDIPRLNSDSNWRRQPEYDWNGGKTVAFFLLVGNESNPNASTLPRIHFNFQMTKDLQKLSFDLPFFKVLITKCKDFHAFRDVDFNYSSNPEFELQTTPVYLQLFTLSIYIYNPIVSARN